MNALGSFKSIHSKPVMIYYTIFMRTCFHILASIATNAYTKPLLFLDGRATTTTSNAELTDASLGKSKRKQLYQREFPIDTPPTPKKRGGRNEL